MDLTEVEDIKKRWQEYAEELCKKDLRDPDKHDCVIIHTHLESNILECEVKWALGSIATNKTSGGDGSPAELFQILKDDAVKVLHSIYQQIWKTHQWTKDWKSQLSFQCQRKAVQKNAQTTALMSHASKVMCNILQARLQQYMNCELPEFKVDLEKAEEPKIKLPTSVGSSRKAREFQHYWLCQSLWLCESQ